MKHVYNEQYITNSNNTNSPSGLRLFIHVSKSSSWHALEQKIPILLQGQEFRPLYRRQKLTGSSRDMHEHIVSNSSSEKLSPSASAMTATMTLAMCFDEQIPQGKIDDYFDTSKVYFTMPNIINQHNELRTRTFGFAVSVSSESFINEAYKKQMPN